MTYAESLERLKKFQKGPETAVTEGPKAPFETFDTAQGGRFQKSPAPEQAAEQAAPADPKRTKTELRIALATAVDGLPITLDELMREFGAEGREGWEAGDYAHPAFLRAFAVAVSERLVREKVDSGERPIEAVPKVTKAPEPGPLDGLPLLRDDLRFIEARTRGRCDRESLLVEYARRWREAAAAEPVEIRKANAGRYAANTWLLEVGR